jgi:hypothetical protein
MTVSIRVQLSDVYAFQSGGIACRIVLADIDERGHVVRALQKLVLGERGMFQWQHITDNERAGMASESDGSVLILPEGVGEALQEALSRYYHGGPAPDRLARADFEHERARRDKLEDVMLGMVDRSVASLGVIAHDLSGVE